MANAPRKKGTAGENEIMETLLPIWPTINRSESGRESQDFVNTDDWIIEVKYRKRWNLFQWIRRIRKLSPNGRWIIACIHGDRRTSEGQEVGRVAVCDWDTMCALLDAYKRQARVLRLEGVPGVRDISLRRLEGVPGVRDISR